MRSRIYVLVLIAVILPVIGDRVARSQNPPSGGSSDIQLIEVTAKKYEFSPSPIRVKQGTRVQLKITSTDHAHGFQIQEFPEGGSSNTPGLIFSSPQHCQKIEKDQTETVEFVAQTPGTYPFKCCVFCGVHHGSMKGQLIVEP